MVSVPNDSSFGADASPPLADGADLYGDGVGLLLAGVHRGRTLEEAFAVHDARRAAQDAWFHGEGRSEAEALVGLAGAFRMHGQTASDGSEGGDA